MNWTRCQKDVEFEIYIHNEILHLRCSSLSERAVLDLLVASSSSICSVSQCSRRAWRAIAIAKAQTSWEPWPPLAWLVTLLPSFKKLVLKRLMYYSCLITSDRLIHREGIVMSRSQQNRLRVASKIVQYDALIVTPCDRCFVFGRNCIMMKSLSRVKCFECVRSKKSCTNLSWEALNKTREKYKKKIQFDEEELTKIINRLLRNKRILQQVDEKAKRKIEHLFDELNQFGELEVFDDCSIASVFAIASFTFWTP